MESVTLKFATRALRANKKAAMKKGARASSPSSDPAPITKSCCFESDMAIVNNTDRSFSWIGLAGLLCDERVLKGFRLQSECGMCGVCVEEGGWGKEVRRECTLL